MMSPDERLAYMANQIARNLAAPGGEGAALMTADHIAAFWDPAMKARLFALIDAGAAGALDPIAARAVALLRTRGAPPPQSEATHFAAGGSDAG